MWGLLGSNDSEYDKMPGLFSERGEWPRASDYELLEKNNHLYVIPTKTASIEYYKPFEHVPEILKEFFTMVRKFRGYDEELLAWSESEKQLVGAQLKEKKKETDIKKGRLYLVFARKFGLLGLFFELLYNIEPSMIAYDDLEDPHQPLVRMKLYGQHRNTESPLDDFDEGNCLYNDYAIWFFPRLAKNYPLPESFLRPLSRSETRFWNEYAESIEWVSRHSEPLLTKFLWWEEWKRAAKKGAKLNDPVDPTRPGMQWLHILSFTVESVGLALEFEYDGTGLPLWQQRYVFKSLLDAIRIMHLHSRVGTFSRIKTCDWCGDIFLVPKKDPSQRWCSPRCRIHYNTTKSRSLNDKNIKQLAADGMCAEKIAAQLKLDTKWIYEWLGEEGLING